MSLRFTDLNLSTRFALLLTIGAVGFIVLFLSFVFYSLNQTELEVERRGQLMAETVGQQSIVKIKMADKAGLKETLKRAVEGSSALAGGFYGPNGTRIASYGLDETLPSSARKMDNEAGARWVETTDGTSVLAATSSVMSDGEAIGSVLTVMPSTVLQETKQTSYLIAGGIVLGIGLLGVFIVVILRRTVSRPVNALREAAEEVRDGRLDVHVDADQGDEIGQLADAFNAMVTASREKTEALEEKSAQAEEALEKAETLQHEAEEEQEYLREQFNRISDVLSAVEQGDLTQRLTVQKDDAVGQLMKQVNAMIDQLANLIQEVETTSSQLSAAAETTASTAAEMSAGTEEQAEQTTEVAAAVEEMSSTVASSSEHAERTNEKAREASELAERGEKVFNRTTQAMERIVEVVNSSSDKVSALGDDRRDRGGHPGAVGHDDPDCRERRVDLRRCRQRVELDEPAGGDGRRHVPAGRRPERPHRTVRRLRGRGKRLPPPGRGGAGARPERVGVRLQRGSSWGRLAAGHTPRPRGHSSPWGIQF